LKYNFLSLSFPNLELNFLFELFNFSHKHGHHASPKHHFERPSV
jgi:hypothetical protein